MAGMFEAETWDHAIIFAVAIIFVVVGGISLFSWLFASLGWSGPLGLMKGGVVA